MNNNFIKVSKQWYEDSNLLDVYGDVGFGFYVYSLHNKLIFNTGSFISISDFLDKLGLNKNTRTKYKQQLYQAITKLEEDGLITFYTNTSFVEVVKFDTTTKDTTIQYCIVKEDKKDTFAKLYYDEFNEIMQSKNPLQLLIHFVVLAGFINNDKDSDNYKIAFPQITTLASYTNTSQDTCIKNNRLLQEMELIYFDNAGVTWDKGYCKSHNNTYARFDEKQSVYNYMDKAIEERKVIAVGKDRRKMGNQSRSLSNKLQPLLVKAERDKESLSQEEKQRLYKLGNEYVSLRGKIDNGFTDEEQKTGATSTLDRVKAILGEMDMTDIKVEDKPEPVVVEPIQATEQVDDEEVEVTLDDMLDDVVADDESWGASNPMDIINDNDIDNVDEVDCDYGWLDELEDEEDYKPKTVVKTKAEINKEMADKWAVSPEWQAVFGEDEEDWEDLFGA